MYINVTSRWHVHLAIICKLLGIDCILCMPTQQSINEVYEYYRTFVSNMIRTVMGYKVDFGTLSNFTKRNFLITNKTHKDSLLFQDGGCNINECEEHFFKHLVDHQYIPNCTSTWREFAAWSYHLITGEEMTRDIYLYMTHEKEKYGFSKGVWLLLCFFTPQGMRLNALPLYVFSTTTPNIVIYGCCSKIKNCETVGTVFYHDHHSPPAPPDIVIWVSDIDIDTDEYDIDWNTLIFLSCRTNCIWCSVGCELCNSEYVCKRHTYHKKPIKPFKWVFGNERVLQNCVTNLDNGECLMQIFKDIHIKVSKVIS